MFIPNRALICGFAPTERNPHFRHEVHQTTRRPWESLQRSALLSDRTTTSHKIRFSHVSSCPFRLRPNRIARLGVGEFVRYGDVLYRPIAIASSQPTGEFRDGERIVRTGTTVVGERARAAAIKNRRAGGVREESREQNKPIGIGSRQTCACGWNTAVQHKWLRSAGVGGD